VQKVARYALRPIILVITIASGTLFFRLGSLPLSGADEPRYARIAQEMKSEGRWVTPILEGRPWLEKPPLYYWTTIASFSVLGTTEKAARIVPALCALASALALFWLGSLLRTRATGLIAASILLTSLGFAGYGRSASTDMPFTCCFTIAMAILAAAIRKDVGGLGIGCAYIFLGLSVLGKGPVALVMAFGIVVIFWFLSENEGVLSRWRIGTGIFITAAVSLPWFWLAFRENGFAFVSTFFLNHNLARYVTGIHHHSQPFFYYLPVILILLFPWSAWLIPALFKIRARAMVDWRHWNPGIIFLACWALFPVLFFTLSDSKLAGYILPSLPPIALILGIRLSETIETNLLRAGAILLFVLSLGMSIAATYYFGKEYGGNWRAGALVSVAILAPSLFALSFGLRGDRTKALWSTVVQGVLMIIAVAQFAFPVLAAYHSTREIATEALKGAKPAEPIVTYGFFHHSLSYYTGYRVYGELDSADSVRSLVQKHGSVLVVIKEQSTKQIQDLSGISSVLLRKQGSFSLFRVSQSPE
jgi:4-amino-4-deoxy-L-arabinose transferase-like glycosyltransferase